MKHCPLCNFSFPDFHFVCDVDGTQLVPDAERLALIKLPARRSFARRFITSPKVLTALAILGLFFAAAFIAYRQTTWRSTRTLLAVNGTTSPVKTEDAVSNREFNPASRSVVPAKIAERPSLRVRRSSPASVAKNRKQNRKGHLSRQMEAATRPNESTSEKQPKFVSMLKTTWRVLRRPFTF